MSFSIRLHSLKCLAESKGPGSDDPYVLITSVDLARWPGPTPPPQGVPPLPPRTFRYGVLNGVDTNEVNSFVAESPFWGIDADPSAAQDITNPAGVCFVVTVMENDQGNPDTIRGLVQTAATTELSASAGLPATLRIARLIDAITSAAGQFDLPTLDLHVGTVALLLNGPDLVPAGQMTDRVLEIGGDERGRWELTFRIVHHHRVVFPKAHIAAVSRGPSLMEIWAVAGDGIVHGNWFFGRWHGWYPLPGERFDLGTNLAAVSRHQNHMEVWGVAPDGVVRGNWFDGERWKGWYSLPGAKFAPGSPLAAVSRYPGRVEIWGVDEHGQVQGRWADEMHWDNWYPLAGMQFPQGAHLAALSRSSDHMELWAVTDDNPIMGRRFHTTRWADWYPLSTKKFAPNTRLAAITRNGSMHVFAVDPNDHVGEYWHDGTSWREWQQMGNEVFDDGTPIAAVSRRADLMEAWAVRPDGFMHDDWFTDNQWRGWFPLRPEQSFDQKSHVAALSLNDNHMEVWAVGNGIMYGNNFSNGAWRGWYPLQWSSDGAVW
jgi:hypothetical protein